MLENYLKVIILRRPCLRGEVMLQRTSIAWSETHLSFVLQEDIS